MMEKFEHLRLALDQFQEFKEIIQQMFREETSIENSLLSKSGFIIKKYTLKNLKLSPNPFLELKKQFQFLISLEFKMRSLLNLSLPELKKIEITFNIRQRETTQPEEFRKKMQVRMIPNYFNNLIINTKNGIVRIDQIILMITKNENASFICLKKQNYFAHLLLSLEKMTNQILQSIQFLTQIYGWAVNTETEWFNPFPRTYGRVMGKKEFESTLQTQKLVQTKDLVPVFDCPKSTQVKVLNFTKDERKNFFNQIGVRNSSHIIIFQTRLKPINENPVPQTNGLYEYKFPPGIEIEILRAA